MSINAVSLAGNDPYRISVDYEVPTKSIQYGNIILDSIASQFDGVATSFALKKDNNAYTPGNAQQLIVILGNDAQKPDQDYVVSGTNIVFTTAPAASTTVSIVALATTADLTRTLNYVVDSGNLAMTPGDKGFITLDVSGVIEQLVIYSEQQGDLVLDIQKADFTTYPEKKCFFNSCEFCSFRIDFVEDLFQQTWYYTHQIGFDFLCICSDSF